MIIYQSEDIPETLENRILKDSMKQFNSITAYTLVNGFVDGYFYKKINMAKANDRYKGNYAELLLEYYMRLKEFIRCNKLIALIQVKKDLYEVSRIIELNKILCDNNDVTYEEIKSMFQDSLNGIKRLENSGDITLGIDSAIWNYSKDGIFFDYDPPKILRGDSLFITENDDDYRKRVLYRNFNYIGMRMNTLGTIILGNKNWNFNIVDLPYNYVEELLDILFVSISDTKIVQKLKDDIFGSKYASEFEKHPIDIVRKELRR